MGRPATLFQFSCTLVGSTPEILCTQARTALEQVLPEGYTLTDQSAAHSLSVSIQDTPLGLTMDMTHISPTTGHQTSQKELSILDQNIPEKKEIYKRFFTYTFSTFFN